MRIGFEIDESKCTECERCMIACTLEKHGLVNLKLSRIRIIRKWPEYPSINVCRFDDCETKACMDVCPVEAITEKDGYILIDENTCTGCGLCVEACPYDAIYQDDEGIAYKCDFCGGDPACVKECVTGAIKVKGE